MSPDTTTVDVAILGAGPAGCAAAIQCAQAGLHVVLLERQPFPREHPGETLHPGIEPLLQQLGVTDAVHNANFLRHRGHWVQWGGDLEFTEFGADHRGPWLGFQAWRSTFDALLLDRVRALDVDIWQPCTATRVLRSGHRVIGLETAQGHLFATYVVDATGTQHWLARHLGLTITEFSPRLIVHYGYGEGHCPERDPAPAMVADAQGWTWTARVRPGLYQWTRLVFDQSPLPPNWWPSDLAGLTPRGKPRGANVTWRQVSESAGAGYFLVGDAAAVLDPAASHGVLKAMMSGMMAGHLLVQRLQAHQPEAQVYAVYCQWLDEWFHRDRTQLQTLYASHNPQFAASIRRKSA